MKRDARQTNQNQRPDQPIPEKQSGVRPMAVFTGTASDNWGVARVLHQLNGRAWNTVTITNGYTNWSQNQELVADTHVLKAHAQELGGNFSLTNNMNVISGNTFTLIPNLRHTWPLTESGSVTRLHLAHELNGNIQVSADLISCSTLTNFMRAHSVVVIHEPATTNAASRFNQIIVP